MIDRLIPEPVTDYVRDHPQVLVYVGCALVAFNLYNLWDSMRFLVKVQHHMAHLSAEAARAASEGLGG